MRIRPRAYGVTHGIRPTFADLREPVARFDAKRFFLKIRAAALLLVSGDEQSLASDPSPLKAIAPPTAARLLRNVFRVKNLGASSEEAKSR